jgi:outer membrane immunogenic protein
MIQRQLGFGRYSALGDFMKCLLVAVLASVTILSLPGVGSAQSNDVILQRFEALEKENAGLRDRVRSLEGKNAAVRTARAASISPMAAYAMTTKAPVAPAFDPRLPFEWSGVHVGIFSSYGFGRWSGTAEDYPHQPVNGWFGGGLIGYDYRLAGSNWIIGVEADIAAADIKQTDNYSDAAITLRLDALATLRSRLGFAWDRSLVYLTGGVAAGHIGLTVNQYHPGGPGSSPFQTSDDHIHYGYAVGAGAQWGFLDNVALKVEYLWINLADATYVFPRAPGFNGVNVAQAGWNGHTAKVGVNWVFN